MSIEATSKVIEQVRFVPIVQLAYVTGKSLEVTTEMLEQSLYKGKIVDAKWWVNECEIKNAFESWLRQRFEDDIHVGDFENMESLAGHSEVYIERMIPRLNYALALDDVQRARVVAGRMVTDMLAEFRVKRRLPLNVDAGTKTSYESKSLVKGDYGLATTYWAWGVLGSFIGGEAVELSLKTGQLSTIFVVFILLVLYMVPVLIGIWNAAKRYQGNIIWANFAKIIVVLSSILLLIQARTILAWFG